MIADLLPIGICESGSQESRNNLPDLPVPVLAEPEPLTRSTDRNRRVSGEARESTNGSVSGSSLASLIDSRGGQNDLSGGVESRHADYSASDQITGPSPTDELRGASGSSAPPAQKRSRGRPRLPDDLLSPDARRMRRVYELRARTHKNGYVRKGRGIRYESGHGMCGLREVGEKVLSDSQVDLAMKYFWGKRGVPVPSATMGGIMPSVSDFNEEVTVLQMRTSI